MKLNSVKTIIWYDLYNLDVYYFEPELFELACNIWGKLYISKIDNIKSTIVVDNN